jgi:hypothetical protein
MIANRVMEYLAGPGMDLDPGALSTAAALCEQTMRRNLGARRDDEEGRRVKGIRPSGSWACARRMVFDSLALEPVPYEWRSRLTFTHGDMTEAMGVLVYRQALTYFNEADTLVTPGVDGVQDTLRVTINPADFGVEGEPFTLTGHVDMTVRGKDGGEDVADWKGISDYAFSNMQGAASNPSHDWWTKEAPGYVAQVRWYMIMLRLLKRGTGQRGYLVGVNKNTGHVTEVQVTRDDAAEALLVRKAVYTLRMNAEGAERRALVLEDREDDGNEATDATLCEWARNSVPRPKWTANMVTRKPGRNERPDGSKGPCLELDTKGNASNDFQGWRCSYCPHTSRCWDQFGVVPLKGGPKFRTNDLPE